MLEMNFSAVECLIPDLWHTSIHTTDDKRNQKPMLWKLFILNAIPLIHQCKSVTRIDVSAFQSPFNLLRTANIWRSEQLLSQHETHRRHTVNYVALRIPLNLVFLGTAIPIWMAHFEPCLSFERILPKLFYQKEKRQTSLRTHTTQREKELG